MLLEKKIFNTLHEILVPLYILKCNEITQSGFATEAM
jgi:hypothetical protein